MDKKLNEYRPKDILLSYEAVQNVVQGYTQQQDAVNIATKFRDLTISTSIAIVSSIISVAASFSGLSTGIRALVGIIGGVLIIYTAICASKWYDGHKRRQQSSQYNNSLESLIQNKAEESMRYTAIIRITYKHKGEMRYLVGADYFLPHCNMTPTSTIYEQTGNIIQSLYDDFQIQERYIKSIVPVDEEVYFSIKPIHTRIQMNAYVFYDAEIKIEAKGKLTEKHEKRNWMTLDNMKRTPSAVATNKDVIDLLSEFPKPKDSFVNVLGDINVIWNITSVCGYKCSICATHDSERSELSTSDKLTVLNSISTAKHLIKTLDFAGGDPFYSDETISIVQSAIGQLGSDKISVTTTGSGIAHLSEKNIQFPDLIKHCEITIDAAHSNLAQNPIEVSQTSRNADSYCKSNMEEIDLLLERAESLTINVPIINDDLSDDEITNLISNIVWVKERNPNVEIDTLLIRLMPVGRLGKEAKEEEYKKYNPISVIQKIKKQLERKDIPCRLHCSLRVLPIFSNEYKSCHCSMLENKIGIDCSGNVFACAWGGYLPCSGPPTKNPFYLGNLTKVDLLSILEGKSRTQPYRNIYREIDSNKKRHYCSVVSYYANRDLFNDFDYLSKAGDDPQ